MQQSDITSSPPLNIEGPGDKHDIDRSYKQQRRLLDNEGTTWGEQKRQVFFIYRFLIEMSRRSLITLELSTVVTGDEREGK